MYPWRLSVAAYGWFFAHQPSIAYTASFALGRCSACPPPISWPTEALSAMISSAVSTTIVQLAVGRWQMDVAAVLVGSSGNTMDDTIMYV